MPLKQQIALEKTKKIMVYNNEELNNLTYELALKYDKRNYFQYYLSLLKTKHTLFFRFFNNDDYNINIIKIDLFIFGFALDYLVNALFFNDDTMHKIYEDKGSFNFIYQLPQIIYSSLDSIIINTLIKFLALSEGTILEYKSLIIFIFYYIVSTIFLLFFWYYLSMFCAIYVKTQIHLIKDTLISFGLSLFYKLFIYFLPGIVRIPSLMNPKKKRNIIYKISKILQMI